MSTGGEPKHARGSTIECNALVNTVAPSTVHLEDRWDGDEQHKPTSNIVILKVRATPSALRRVKKRASSSSLIFVTPSTVHPRSVAVPSPSSPTVSATIPPGTPQTSRHDQSLNWHTLRNLVRQAGVYWLKEGEYEGPELELLWDQLRDGQDETLRHPCRIEPRHLVGSMPPANIDEPGPPVFLSSLHAIQQRSWIAAPMILLSNPGTNGNGDQQSQKLFAVAERTLEVNRWAPGKPSCGVFAMMEDDGVERDFHIQLNAVADQFHPGIGRAGESRWRWPLGQIRFYEEQGMELPFHALSGPYHPTWSETAPVHVNIALLGDIEVSAIELMTFFPSLTRWPHYVRRLRNNGWSSASDIAACINRAWDARGWLMVDRSRIAHQQRNADRTLNKRDHKKSRLATGLNKARRISAPDDQDCAFGDEVEESEDIYINPLHGHEPVEDLTCASWKPPKNFKSYRKTLIDYYLIDLVTGIDPEHLPTGDDEMALTMAVRIILAKPAWRFLKLSNLKRYLPALGIAKRLKAKKAAMGMQGSELDREAAHRHKDDLKAWRERNSTPKMHSKRSMK